MTEALQTPAKAIARSNAMLLRSVQKGTASGAIESAQVPSTTTANACSLPPKFVMESRTASIVRGGCSYPDRQDFFAQQKRGPSAPRIFQLAPEYSSEIYRRVAAAESMTGNFFLFKYHTFNTAEANRATMIEFVEQIHEIRNYREETYFLAVDYSNRYLHALGQREEKISSLVLIGIVALVLAAKMNEVEQPNLQNLIEFVNKEFGKSLLTKDAIIKTERDMLVTLQWDLNAPTPLFFIERFMRILNMVPYTVAGYFAEVPVGKA